MIVPTIDLTRFDRDHRTNHFFDSCRYVTASDDDATYTMATYMVDCIAKHTNEGSQPRYWSFAQFRTKKHEKAAIRFNTAAVLEYPASAKGELEMQLGELGYAHWLVPTEDTASNMVAVIIPFSAPVIMDPKSNRYSRIASCLLKEIGVEGATEGCIAATFLIQPICNATVEGFGGNILDPDAYLAATADWKAKAAAYVGAGEAEKPAADMDSLFQWPALHGAIRTLHQCAADIEARKH